MPVPTTVHAVMNPQSLRFVAQPIEPLESRIAPALLFVGNPDADDLEYRDAPFVKTSAGVAINDPISLILGGNENVYYIKLTPGDQVALFGGDNGGTGYSNFITGPSGTGLKGTVIAVFNDLDADEEVDPGELSGLSLGKNVKIQISGTVFGDVVANYNDATGSLGGAGEPAASGKDLLNNNISFFGASNVTGNIIAGGKIQSINITGSANQILTGNAANTLPYDFNGPAEDGGDVFEVIPGVGKAGPGISKVTIGDVTKIQAGGGGAGGKGGSITNVTLISDTNGWTIQGGAGGDGGSGRPKGGAGGTVSNILANGLDANTVDSSLNDVVQVLGGKGGDGSAGGGKGGALKNISIGYEGTPQGRGVQRSINSIADSVLVEAGAGGTGRIGGTGGGLTNIDVFASPTLSGNDLTLHGGAGGDSVTAGGKGGTGGAVKDFDLRNPGISADAQQSRMFIDGGDGGLTTGVTSAGAKGGAVEKGVLVGFSIGITGGNGSQGTKGGAGGNVRSILAEDGFFDVRAKNVAIDAGGGGIGTAGRGGKGGLIDVITIRNPELSQFDINQTVGAGDGGNSQKGAGAAGGAVSNITVNDVNTLASSEVTMRISAGDGGSGGTSGGNGGKGGAIAGKNVLSGINAALLANGGNGGAATGKGSGGAGGGITSISFTAIGDVAAAPAGASVIGGIGGAGNSTGKGGAGGNLSTLSAIVDGNVLFQAGAGGSGGTAGAAGKGGSVANGATISAEGSTTITGGVAGVDGTKAGAGGSINQINVQAATTIEIRGGAGSKGGAGGSIKEIGVSDVTQLAGPSAGLLIIAGNGSGNGSVAGAGGSVTGIDGFIASSGETRIQAGEGGTGSTKGGAGGAVNTITLRGGGGVGAIVNIEAGNGGDATGAKVGAKGGSVTNVGIGLNPFVTPTLPPGPIDPFAVQAGTLIRHIAAGDGGNAGSGKGGVGGAVQDVRAYYDIGAMAGEVFGYSTMGGIFAGAGGAGSTAGASGAVVNISADSIAAILAGRLENGEVITQSNLASSVDGLVLNSSVAATVNGNGTYINYDTASLVGAIRNPGDPGVAYPAEGPHANTFDPMEYTDSSGDGKFSIGDTTTAATDGFVAALKFATSAKFPTSVRPEAVLTADGFTDLNNTNGQIIIL